jgi:hypothetical protein
MVSEYLKQLKYFGFIGIIIGLTVFAVTIVVYSVFSSSQFNYNTHYTEYNFAVSAAYKSGSVPATIVMVILLLATLGFLALLRYGNPSTKFSSQTPFKSLATSINSFQMYGFVIIKIIILLCFLLLYAVVNVGYIVATLSGLNRSTLIILQLVVSLFDVFYANQILYTFINAYKKYLFQSDTELLYFYISLKM